MRRLAPFEIDVAYDCILRAHRHIIADYVEEQDAKYLRDVKVAAEDLLNTLESIEVKEAES